MKLEPSVLGAESLSRETQGQAPARHTEATVRAVAFLVSCPLPADQRGGDSGETLIIVTTQIMPFLQFKYSYRCILHQLYIYILQNIFISVSYAHTHTHTVFNSVVRQGVSKVSVIILLLQRREMDSPGQAAR